MNSIRVREYLESLRSHYKSDRYCSFLIPTHSFFSTSTGLALAEDNDWNPIVKAAIERAVSPAAINTQISMGVLYAKLLSQ